MISPIRVIRKMDLSPLFVLAAAWSALVGPAIADDWPHWRGLARNDRSGETSGWTGSKWPIDKPVWTQNVGVGCSSPIVVGEKLYVTGWAAGQESLRCLDVKTGKELRRQSHRCPQYGRYSTGDKGIYAGPSSTPEYDSETGRLYTLSIDGDLNCRDGNARGKRVWSHNLYEKYGVKRRPNVGRSRRMLRDYGYTSSPLVLGNALIVEVGAKAGNLIALDKRSGKELWKSQNKDEAGHTGGAVPMTVDGIPCVAILTIRNLVVVRTDPDHAGETLSQYKWTTDFANNIPTPAVQGNSVIITSAYNHYAMCRLDVSRGGVKKVWEKNLPSGVCSPIIHNGRVYWSWRGVHCVDFATGKRLWSGGRTGTPGSCILTKDDRLIVWANQGDLLLVDTAERSPKAYRELSRNSGILHSDAWPHVVLAGGRLFVKDRRGNLACFKLR
jgi:outer membrane protein assembly factor BamB